MFRSRFFPLLVFTLAMVMVGPSFSAPKKPRQAGLPSTWSADWIAAPEAPPRNACVVNFRKTFELAQAPEHFLIHVSGDNRYELFVNGTRVAIGPARGDIFHWREATLDIAPHLRAGKNLLAAEVWNYGQLYPVAQMSNQTGFFLRGDSETESVADTNTSWKCLLDRSWKFLPVDRSKIDGYYAAGPNEKLDASAYPWGWQEAGFDDSSWPAAVSLGSGRPRGAQDAHSRWMLVPRNIPMMEMTPQRLARVVRSKGVEPSPAFVEGNSPVTVPANTHATILFDQGEETTGYPELVVSGGRDADVSLVYAEALYKGDHKGNRNVTEGKEIRGVEDFFVPDGGQNRMFRPLQWRTWRYMQLAVTTKSEPLQVEDLRSVFTAYPFKLKAKFESGDPTLEKIWKVGWHTARLCAHSTYMDCPYYERLQYVGDTRVQALISIYNAGDDRLAKNAIECLNESRIPEGLTMSRYPSELAQIIPPFSLYWVSMMRDLWWYDGQTSFIKPYLAGERGVLDWFERRMSPTGMLGRLDWWDFVDWTPGFHYGVPPQEDDGQSATLSLQFVDGLHNAADLEEHLGSKSLAAQDRALAARINHAVYTRCWVPSRGLLADTPAHKQFSQHANILGVLTGAIPAAEQKAVMRKVLTDTSLSQCSYYFRFYLFLAMKKAGLADEYLQQLGPWKEMLDLGLTTWAEKPEPTRSDCHAWSSHPNIDLLAIVAGIEPAAPGFRQVRIAPNLGALKHLKASMPSPQGEIAVEYQRQGEGVRAQITLPTGVTGTFVWRGKTHALHAGEQQFVM